VILRCRIQQRLLGAARHATDDTRTDVRAPSPRRGDEATSSDPRRSASCSSRLSRDPGRGRSRR
jgi:hypothetical protein